VTVTNLTVDTDKRLIEGKLNVIAQSGLLNPDGKVANTNVKCSAVFSKLFLDQDSRGGIYCIEEVIQSALCQTTMQCRFNSYYNSLLL
jgi:hypothetical protein